MSKFIRSIVRLCTFDSVDRGNALRSMLSKIGYTEQELKDNGEALSALIGRC